MIILILALFALLIFADNANFEQVWLDRSVATILDMIKVVVGAAVGSISAAFAALLNNKN